MLTWRGKRRLKRQCAWMSSLLDAKARPRRKLQDVGLSLEDTKPGSLHRAVIDPVEEQESSQRLSEVGHVRR